MGTGELIFICMVSHELFVLTQVKDNLEMGCTIYLHTCSVSIPIQNIKQRSWKLLKNKTLKALV